MLTEERYQYILEYLQGARQRHHCRGADRAAGASESTIRRDLNALGNLGKLLEGPRRRDGTAPGFSYVEHPIETKSKPTSREKRRIGQYAAQTIRKDDFLFLDAGTTTGMMIDYITEPSIQIVTNGFSHAPAAGAAGGSRSFSLAGRSRRRRRPSSGRRSAGHCAVPFLQGVCFPRRQRHRPDQRVHDAGPGRGECQAKRRPVS